MYKPKYHKDAKVLIALAVLASLPLNGCGQSDEPLPDDTPTNTEQTVVFGAYISDDVESRATVANLQILKKTGFGVFASQTGNLDYDPDASAGFTSDFMYNQRVFWKAASSGLQNAGAWVHDSNKFWPSDKVSFFAYAPYTSTFGATGITGISDKDATGGPMIEFTMESDIDKQIDLLYADADRTTNLTNAGKVDFNFKHALSRIGFRCCADETIDGSTTVTINSVTLRSSSLAGSGKLNLATGTWDVLSPDFIEYTLGTDDFVAGSYVLNSAKGTEVSELTRDGKFLMLIPSDKIVPVEIMMNYNVLTVDPSLAGGKFEVQNEYCNRFNFNFETGKAYHFTLRLGMKSVKIIGEEAAWDTDNYDWTPVEKE